MCPPHISQSGDTGIGEGTPSTIASRLQRGLVRILNISGAPLRLFRGGGEGFAKRAHSSKISKKEENKRGEGRLSEAA